MELKSGVALQGGRYRIVECLGSGGFGITYLAEQPLADRMVCIKEFFPTNYYNREVNTNRVYIGTQGSADAMERFKAKFIKEAQMIARLDHPNIIPIYDIFEENNTAYYVMKYVDGGSLGDIVKRNGAMAEAEAVRYIRGVASALAYIHQRSVNHLDIKPGNIMLLKAENQPLLIDFGLSKHYDDSGEQTTSTPGGVSHGYAPIEQYKQGGVASFSPASDIYSLGATLYYLVTGVVPPSATDIGRDGIDIPVSHISDGVRSAIKAAMSYWREDRPQNIEDFIALLDEDADNMPMLEATIADDVTRYCGGDERTKVNMSPAIEVVVNTPEPVMPKKQPSAVQKSNVSNCNGVVLLLLFLFLGFYGTHRFYAGKYFSAVLYMFTCGGFFIWTIVDFVKIITGRFTDDDGREIKI